MTDSDDERAAERAREIPTPSDDETVRPGTRHAASSPLPVREALLEKLERVSRTGTWFWRPATGHVTWSDELFRILGVDPALESASVEGFFRAVHPDDRERVQAAAARGLETGVPEVVEYRLLHPDGTVREVRMEGAFLHDDAGEIDWAVGTIFDHTEARRNARSLARASTLVESAQRLANLGSWTYDVTDGTVEWSDQLVRIFGLPPETEPSEDTFHRLVHPDDLPAVRAHETEAVAGSARQHYEYRIVRPDGEVRTLETFEEPILDEGGALRGFVGTSVDVTERRELEAQLLQAQKLDAIGRLSGEIAHDFNNLLTAILGGTEMALTRLDDPETARRFLDQVKSSIQIAAQLTRQLLTFSRRDPLHLEHLDLARTLREATTLLGRMVSGSVRPSLDVRDEPIWIEGDTTKIQQVVMNLVLNARDSGARAIGIVLQREGPDFAILRVVDDGSGMSDEVRARAIEPFFSTKDPGRGTGLGLATVHGIVTAHGGTLELESALGRGTVATVRFPLRPPGSSNATDDATSDETDAGQRVRILVIEDEPRVRRALAEVLGSLGHLAEAVEAYPADAEELVQRFPRPRLVVCDVTLPGPDDGFRLVEALRGHWPDLPVLFVSGHPDASAPPGDDGATILRKPFSRRELARAVRTALSEAADRHRP